MATFIAYQHLAKRAVLRNTPSASLPQLLGLPVLCRIDEAHNLLMRQGLCAKRISSILWMWLHVTRTPPREYLLLRELWSQWVSQWVMIPDNRGIQVARDRSNGLTCSAKSKPVRKPATLHLSERSCRRATDGLELGTTLAPLSHRQPRSTGPSRIVGARVKLRRLPTLPQRLSQACNRVLVKVSQGCPISREHTGTLHTDVLS